MPALNTTYFYGGGSEDGKQTRVRRKDVNISILITKHIFYALEVDPDTYQGF